MKCYSPDTGMHCVAYGSSDKRWYDLSRTVYEVIGVERSSSEEEEEEEEESEDDA